MWYRQMKRFGIPLLSIAVVLGTIIASNCAGMQLQRPQGERIASCEGEMFMETGGARDFRIDVYRKGDEEFSVYLTMPGHGVRYRPIEDISFESGILTIETGSPNRLYTGSLNFENMKFKGWWNEWSGVFSFKSEVK